MTNLCIENYLIDTKNTYIVRLVVLNTYSNKNHKIKIITTSPNTVQDATGEVHFNPSGLLSL
jgi:hypothetical protein